MMRLKKNNSRIRVFFMIQFKGCRVQFQGGGKKRSSPVSLYQYVTFRALLSRHEISRNQNRVRDLIFFSIRLNIPAGSGIVHKIIHNAPIQPKKR